MINFHFRLSHKKFGGGVPHDIKFWQGGWQRRGLVCSHCFLINKQTLRDVSVLLPTFKVMLVECLEAYAVV